MKYSSLTTLAGIVFFAAAQADDPTPPAPPLPTHVDTTVVGSSVAGNPDAVAHPPTLDNTHNFVAGGPELIKITKRLNLSPKQEAQLRAVIEKSDAGAGILIGRENDIKQMIAATTPADPMYAKLIADQSAGDARWTENRQNLQRDVEDILTPKQRTRFEELQSQQSDQNQQ